MEKFLKYCMLKCAIEAFEFRTFFFKKKRAVSISRKKCDKEWKMRWKRKMFGRDEILFEIVDLTISATKTSPKCRMNHHLCSFPFLILFFTADAYVWNLINRILTPSRITTIFGRWNTSINAMFIFRTFLAKPCKFIIDSKSKNWTFFVNRFWK